MNQKEKTRVDGTSIDASLRDVPNAGAQVIQTDSNMAGDGFQARLALRPKEAAALLGVGHSAMYTLCRRSDFPAFRVGQSYIIPIDGLRRWLAQRTGTYVEVDDE